MPRVHRSRSRGRFRSTRSPNPRVLATILALLLVAGGVALAQPASDLAALEARLQATEAELDAAADALRVLRDAAAQGKRFVVADRPLGAAGSLDDALRHGQPPVVGTLEQAIAVITFYYLLGVTEATPFDATVLADWVRRYLQEDPWADQRTSWLEERVGQLERQRDDLRAELGAPDPTRDCIRLVRVEVAIGTTPTHLPEPILELDGEVSRYVSPERVGLGNQRYGGIVLEWTPPPAQICVGDRFVLSFGAVNLGPSEQRGGTGGRVQLSRSGGVPTFECSSDPLALAHVYRHERDPQVNVCTFTVASLATVHLDPRAQFMVSGSGTARGAVIRYYYTR